MTRLPIPAADIALGPAPAVISATDTDKAYAAGFFDGEGNICIAANKAGGKNGRYLVYNMRVGASQNEVAPLAWLRDRWGGTLGVRSLTDTDHHTWVCFSRGALAFLNDVLPYLVVKRDRALLAIDYQERITQRGRAGRTPEHVDWLASAKAEMNRMNAKRPVRRIDSPSKGMLALTRHVMP